MLAVLGSLLGIIGSVLPKIVSVFEKKQELNHDLEMAKLENSLQNRQVDVQEIQAAVDEGKSLREHDSSLDGGVFFNTLRASIRPVITYIFFALFVAVKFSAAYVMMATGYSVPDMLTAVWDPDTSGLFGTIIAFWFGSRMFEKIGSVKVS